MSNTPKVKTAKPKKVKKAENAGKTLKVGNSEFPWTSPKLWFFIVMSEAMFNADLTDEGAMKLFQLQVKFLRSGLSKKSWKVIEDRLNDPDDKLDVTDLSDAVLNVFGVEEASVPSS